MKHRPASGAILILAIFMTLILALLSVNSLKMVSLETRMGAHHYDHGLAFASAEFALKEAENWLMTQATETIPSNSCSGLGCIRTLNTDPTPENMDEATWDSIGTTVQTVVNSVTKQPQYIIEFLQFLPENPLELGQTPLRGKYFYRITARGEGYARRVVFLQSFVFREFT